LAKLPFISPYLPRRSRKRRADGLVSRDVARQVLDLVVVGIEMRTQIGGPLKVGLTRLVDDDAARDFERGIAQQE
jgi:hypothetical protein